MPIEPEAQALPRDAPPYTNGFDPAAPFALALPAAIAGAVTPRPFRAHPAELVAKAPRLVEDTTTAQEEIALQLGIGKTTLSNRIRRHNWTRPAGAPVLRAMAWAGATDAMRRPRLVARLYIALGKQLAGIEKRVRAAGGETVEKDARTLGVLAKTLETLIALDRDDGAKAMEPEYADRDELDAALAERISRWAEGGQEPAGTVEGPAAGIP